MAEKPINKIEGLQIDTIFREAPLVQESFDLFRMDAFTIGLGVQFLHYKSMPSPIGQKDRGDYRRSDGVDTITSNGMIYRLAGKMTCVMTDNSRSRKQGDAGTLDPSESKLVLPRFYDGPNSFNGNEIDRSGGCLDDCNQNDQNGGGRIYLSPGDRIYVSDPTADVLVSNQQKMDFYPDVDNIPMFPIKQLEMPIIDSRNVEYIQDVDFTITPQGNIRWLSGGKNPGIDPDTGLGRIYSVRYLYVAYWYITVLLKEVRVTNVTTDGVRQPERMSYHCLVQREYIFHNQNRGDELNQLKPKNEQDLIGPINPNSDTGKRVDARPTEAQNPAKYNVRVDMRDLDTTDENEDE